MFRAELYYFRKQYKEALGELNGKRIREDLVQTIFSRFCVGK